MDGKVNLYSLCTSCGLSKSENIDKKKTKWFIESLNYIKCRETYALGASITR